VIIYMNRVHYVLLVRENCRSLELHIASSAPSGLRVVIMMKAAGSAVFVWTGAQSAVWASHSGDSAFDENWRVAAKAMQLGVTCDGRHRCPPSAKT
jgi:hypothetical protein